MCVGGLMGESPAWAEHGSTVSKKPSSPESHLSDTRPESRLAVSRESSRARGDGGPAVVKGERREAGLFVSRTPNAMLLGLRWVFLCLLLRGPFLGFL